MKNKMRWDCLLKDVDVFLGIVAVLFLISLGLEVYTLQIQSQANFVGTLLFLFIASWIRVLGITCLILLPVWLLVRAKMRCRSSAESQVEERLTELMRRAS